MPDAREERKYEMLRGLAQELHIPIPEAFWTLEVFDKDGKLLQRHHQRSHSWVRNTYNMLFSQMAGKNIDDDTFGAGKLSIKLTDGTVKHGTRPAGQPTEENLDGGTTYGYRAAAGEDSHGILVGSGTDAEDFEDYSLQTQIVEGSGAGQLSHTESEAHSVSYAGLTMENELVRYFNNNSGGDVSVNEVVLATYGHAYGVWDFIVSRDKLTSTVTVPDTGQLRVTYTIQLTYPS